jgi:hypothetical protein
MSSQVNCGLRVTPTVVLLEGETPATALTAAATALVAAAASSWALAACPSPGRSSIDRETCESRCPCVRRSAAPNQGTVGARLPPGPHGGLVGREVTLLLPCTSRVPGDLTSPRAAIVDLGRLANLALKAQASQHQTHYTS